MKISVVIPSFNSRSLQTALESVLAQTVRPEEVIIVDDASTDTGALEVLRKIEGLGSRNGIVIKVVRFAANRGPSAARNAGLDQAKGDYVAFLDDDDRWAAEKLETQARFMESHPQYPLTAHWFDYQPRKIAGEFPLWKLLLSNSISPCCIMMRRSLSTRFDESFRYCEDHEFAVSVRLRAPIYILPETLTFLGRRPQTPGGASAHKLNMRRGQIAIYWKLHRNGNLNLFNTLSLSSLALLKHAAKALVSWDYYREEVAHERGRQEGIDASLR